MGVVNGITGAIGSAAKAAANMAKSAMNAAKDFLGIHSPSRMMRDQVGRFFSEGMSVGITKNAGSVTGAASDMAQSAAAAASGYVGPTIGMDATGTVSTSGPQTGSAPTTGPTAGFGTTGSSTTETTNNGGSTVNYQFGQGSVVIQAADGESGESLLAKLEAALQAKAEASLA
jgi:hypothetical protein